MRKDKYSYKVGLKRTRKLNKREKKYCSCVMKVRGNHFKKHVKDVKRTKKTDLLNPYAICNKAVLKNIYIKNKLINLIIK